MEHVLSERLERAPTRLRRPARLLRLASDERLVALVRAGDEGAFEALYDRHHPAILGFCRHMLGTRDEAEDAVQHTFLAAFRDLVRDEKQIELRPWLFAIARNRCVSLLRARRQHVAIELAEPAIDGLAATVERREDLRELLADLARLPEDQRAALLLAELGALDHAGIATVLGCPREKVKALVFQARTSLAASREARATPCDEIRLELATASGAALRRGPLRRHLRACEGCRAFKAEVATQRKLLALALPVVPSIALKASVLSGTGGGGASASSGGAVAAASATTAGAGSGVSGGTLGGVLGTVASTGAGKVAMSLAVAGVVASGGALTEQIGRQAAAPSTLPPASLPALMAAPGAAPSARLGLAAPARRGATEAAGAVDPAALPGIDAAPGTSSRAPARRASSLNEPASAHAHDRAGGGSAPGAVREPAHSTPATPARPAPSEGGGRGGDATPQPPAATPTPAPPPQAQGKAPDPPPPPAHGRAPSAPGSAAADSQPTPTPPSASKAAEPGASASRAAPAAPASPGGQLAPPAPPVSRPAPPAAAAPDTPSPAASRPVPPAPAAAAHSGRRAG
jgi:RNA polymerase sigma factor (sigma-70 family)